MQPAYAGLLRWKQAPLEPAWKQVLIDIVATILTAVCIVPYFTSIKLKRRIEMQIIKFKGCNVTYAKNQPEYLPLPSHKAPDGTVTSCWGLSFFERLQVALTGRIYLQVLTFNQPLQPLKMSTTKPLQVPDSADAPPGPVGDPGPIKYYPVG